MIPILKPDKDPTNPTNYRPIALKCCMDLSGFSNHTNCLLIFIEASDLTYHD